MDHELELQAGNYQDAWGMLYLFLARAVTDGTGMDGELLLREGIKNFGIDRGKAQRKEHLSVGLKPNMENLFGYGDLPGDPRFRRNQLRLNPQERISETLVCPIANIWREMDGFYLGRIYCEEFHHAKFDAYAPKTQTNLSQTITQGDALCRFSVYLRPSNLSEAERRETFAEFDKGYDKSSAGIPFKPSLKDGFTMMCVKIFYHIAIMAIEADPVGGPERVRTAAKNFGLEFSRFLQKKAAQLKRPYDLEFVRANAPIDFTADDPGHAVWALYADKRPEKLFAEGFYPAFGMDKQWA